jgi:thymidine phosphorylase
LEEWVDVVQRAREGGLSIREVAALATRLADSGKRLPSGERRADLASTGGPTSLSTLICPAMLVAAGWTVPKLGVPGRPAGGVDVLSGVAGYRVDLGLAEADKVISTCGYVHLVAGAAFAPADAALFRYRQSIGAQAVPDLAIASLLSKKLAMGVRRVGLEVRVAPHGNFGADLSSARANALRFIEACSVLGLEGACIVTDGTRPYQPFVGRGEAVLALQLILEEREDGSTARHVEDCWTMASVVTGEARIAVSRIAFADALLANVAAQGGSADALRARAVEVEAGHTQMITAASEGAVDYDLGRLRSALVEFQGDRKPGDLAWPDAAGVVLRACSGQTVERGDVLMTVRCSDTDWPGMKAALAEAVSFGHPRVEPRSAILEIVGV